MLSGSWAVLNLSSSHVHDTYLHGDNYNKHFHILGVAKIRKVKSPLCQTTLTIGVLPRKIVLPRLLQ